MTFTEAKRRRPASHPGVTAALCTVVTPSQLAVQAHIATSGPLLWRLPTTRLPTTRLAHTLAGCGHGGTRKSSTSRSVQTWSVSPAAMAGVQGRLVIDVAR